MIADAKYKYHEYVDYPPELFDLESDSGEVVNLAAQPEYQTVVDRYAKKLRGMLDPVATDANAKDDQAAWVRSEERRVGKACVSTCRLRGWPEHQKKKQQLTWNIVY